MEKRGTGQAPSGRLQRGPDTGSDVRAAEIARQAREVFGRGGAEITVMALEGYFDPDVTLLPFSSLFPLDLWKACASHHALILCEGSTLKSTFANALTLFLCEAAGIMGAQGKPCIAYGSEIGRMAPYIERAARHLCRNTWFITRTEGSFASLKKLGLKGHAGTDAAWSWNREISPARTARLLEDQGWDGKKDLLGIAVIDPFCWPVRASLFRWIWGILRGDLSGRYDKWYFFSASEERSAAYGRYIRSLAAAVRTFSKEHDLFPVLLGMEALDRKACLDLRSLPDAPSALFLSEENDAKVMTGILRSLSLLVTSRYHAAVLSMEGGCPITAVSMDERMIRPLLPSMVVEKSKDMVMVRGIGVGGTTTLATGNAVRCDDSLRALGIDLDGEFERLYADLPITTDHRARWTPVTKKMFSVFERMDLSPVVTPKFLDPSRCIQCGHCAIGCRVTSLKISGNAVAQVIARRRGMKTSYQADLVVLAAGGLGTPVILKNSGIPCQDSLFADPVICVAGPLPGIRQDRQFLMPFISQQEGYILSPYMDYLSFFFNKD